MSPLQANTDQPLTVKLFHATVTAHQENAIICLSLLKDLAEKTPAFRRLISQALVDTSYQEGKSILDNFFLYDSSLWISKCVCRHTYIHMYVRMYGSMFTQNNVFTCSHVHVQCS